MYICKTVSLDLVYDEDLLYVAERIDLDLSDIAILVYSRSSQGITRTIDSFDLTGKYVHIVGTTIGLDVPRNQNEKINHYITGNISPKQLKTEIMLSDLVVQTDAVQIVDILKVLVHLKKIRDSFREIMVTALAPNCRDKSTSGVYV